MLPLLLFCAADNMNRQLYAKSLDSQEGLLLSVFEDVIGQLLKRVRIPPPPPPPPSALPSLLSTKDSNEGLCLSLLDHRILQVTLAYFCLIQQSSLIEVATLDRLVEGFLQRAFGCKMDFAVELALKKLQMERLASFRGVR